MTDDEFMQRFRPVARQWKERLIGLEPDCADPERSDWERRFKRLANYYMKCLEKIAGERPFTNGPAAGLDQWYEWNIQALHEAEEWWLTKEERVETADSVLAFLEQEHLRRMENDN